MKDVKEILGGEESSGRWKWYHGALFFVFTQGLTYGLSYLAAALNPRDELRRHKVLPSNYGEYYASLKEASFAPPRWLFAPAWTINNVFMIWGLIRTLNMKQSKEGRGSYLALQAATWVDYSVFSAAFFGLQSPINALVVTFAMLVITIAGGFVALFRLRDSKVALSLLTLFVWLIVATSSAVCQALWNRDPLYGVGPLVSKPPKALVK